jgi:hypothetical protein
MSDEEALRIAQYMGGVNIWAIWIAAPILLFFFVYVGFTILELIKAYVNSGRSPSNSGGSL